MRLLNTIVFVCSIFIVLVLNLLLIEYVFSNLATIHRIIWTLAPFVILTIVASLAKTNGVFRAFSFIVSLIGTVVCYIALLLIHNVEPLYLLLCIAIGAVLGLTMFGLMSNPKRSPFSSFLFILVGSLSILVSLWRNPQFGAWDFLWSMLILVLPIASLMLSAPNFKLASLARLINTAQLNIGIWISPIALFGISDFNNIPWFVFLLCLMISGLLIYSVSASQWAENEFLWYGMSSQLYFPFRMRIQEPSLSNFNLEEITLEPPASVTAARATVWVFRDKAGMISRLLLTGHANLPICREVSAKLYTTLIELGSKVQASLLAPGAFEVEINPIPATQSPDTPEVGSPTDKFVKFLKPTGLLDDLYHQLQQMQSETGLVNIIELKDKQDKSIRAVVPREVGDFRRSRKDKILIPKSNSALDDVAFLPFYSLRSGNFEPISIEIDAQLLYGREFDYLVKQHRLALVLEMTKDAHRRKEVYTEWAHKDEIDLKRLAVDIFKTLIPSLTIKDVDSLLNELTKLTVSALQSMPSTLQTGNLGEFIDKRQAAASKVNIRYLLKKYRSFKDGEWKEKIQRYVALTIPVQGVRNYLEATVGETGAVAKYISQLDLIEGHLPSLIQTDHEWINKMDELITKFEKTDPVRENRIREINIGTFLDSFLRGWPSFFLEDEKSQVMYQEWCDSRRKVVWQAIRSKLAEFGIRADPLIEDNVVFRVQLVNSEIVRITPVYLATNRDAGLLLSGKIGMTYYINYWQRRQKAWMGGSEPANREGNDKLSKKSLKSAEEEIKAQDYAQAKKYYHQALRTHPYIGATEIISSYWNCFPNLSSEYSSKAKLVEALNLMNRHGTTSLQMFNEFIQRFPDYIPDPYLFLSFLNASRNYREEEKNLRQLAQEHSSIMEALVRKGVLVPENSSMSDPQQGRTYSARLSPWETNSNDQIKKLNALQIKIDGKRSKLQKEYEGIWKVLAEKMDDDLARAMSINPDYVNQVISQKALFTSIPYLQNIGPILSLLRADEYLEIYRSLIKASQLVDTLNENLKQLLQITIAAEKVHYLSVDEISGLVDLQRTLESMLRPDAIEREMVIRGKIDKLRQNYLFNAYRGYKDAVALPEFPQAREKYALVLFYMARYKRSLDVLLNPPLLPLYATYTDGKFKVLDYGPHSVQGFRLADNVILIQTGADSWLPILSVEGLSDPEYRHLENELGKSGFKERFLRLPLNPAYALLRTPIAHSPSMVGRLNLLKGIQEWLLYSMAYAGVTPMPDADQAQEAVDAFESTPVLEGIIVDTNRISGQITIDLGINFSLLEKGVLF